MKQQQFKGINSISSSDGPQPVEASRVKDHWVISIFSKPTYVEKNERSMADMLSRHPCDSVMRMIIKADNGRVIV